MQTLQYTRTLREIVRELKVPDLIAFLTPYVTRGSNTPIPPHAKDQFSELLFSSRAGYERIVADERATKILMSLKIDAIYQPARLGRLLSVFSQQGSSTGIWSSQENFTEFFSFLTLLQSLSDVEKSCSALLEEERIGQAVKGGDILELQLLDYAGTGIEEARLAQFVGSVAQLHTDFARMLGVVNDEIRFIYFDSGSDLLTGIQCAKAVLDSIRTLLSEWWEQVRFRGFEEFDKKMNAVSSSLTVMTSVQDAVERKVIDAETGDLLKTRVLREVDNLIGIGASLSMHDMVERVDQRRLLSGKRDARLLGAGQSGAGTQEAAGSGASDERET